MYGPRDSGEVRAAKLAAENVAADRSAVVEAWTSSQVLAAVRSRGIKLGGYHDFFPAGK